VEHAVVADSSWLHRNVLSAAISAY